MLGPFVIYIHVCRCHFVTSIGTECRLHVLYPFLKAFYVNFMGQMGNLFFFIHDEGNWVMFLHESEWSFQSALAFLGSV